MCSHPELAKPKRKSKHKCHTALASPTPQPTAPLPAHKFPPSARADQKFPASSGTEISPSIPQINFQPLPEQKFPLPARFNIYSLCPHFGTDEEVLHDAELGLFGVAVAMAALAFSNSCAVSLRFGSPSSAPKLLMGQGRCRVWHVKWRVRGARAGLGDGACEGVVEAWCGLCGDRGGWLACGRCMGEGGFPTRPGLAGVKGKVGWARCKTCFGHTVVPCLFCGVSGVPEWKLWLEHARRHPRRSHKQISAP